MRPLVWRGDAGGNTPLKIPYGNKEVALSLAPATLPAVGMRRRVLILLPSKKGAGCNVRQPFLRVGPRLKLVFLFAPEY